MQGIPLREPQRFFVSTCSVRQMLIDCEIECLSIKESIVKPQKQLALRYGRVENDTDRVQTSYTLTTSRDPFCMFCQDSQSMAVIQNVLVFGKCKSQNMGQNSGPIGHLKKV